MCQKLGSPTASWSDGTYMGLNGSKVQDKEWAAVDPRNNNIAVCWTQFDVYGSFNAERTLYDRFPLRGESGFQQSNPAQVIHMYWN